MCHHPVSTVSIQQPLRPAPPSTSALSSLSFRHPASLHLTHPLALSFFRPQPQGPHPGALRPQHCPNLALRISSVVGTRNFGSASPPSRPQILKSSLKHGFFFFCLQSPSSLPNLFPASVTVRDVHEEVLKMYTWLMQFSLLGTEWLCPPNPNVKSVTAPHVMFWRWSLWEVMRL